jgi:hypothetical protein
MKNKIDIEFYRKAKADFINNLKRRNVSKWEEFNNELSLYCACFGLPVFVAIVFCEEDFPEYAEELAKKKEIVREFYGYE